MLNQYTLLAHTAAEVIASPLVVYEGTCHSDTTSFYLFVTLHINTNHTFSDKGFHIGTVSYHFRNNMTQH